MFKWFEFYVRDDTWRHPDWYVWGIRHCPQGNGCIIFDIGFFQLTFVKGDCQGKEL